MTISITMSINIKGIHTVCSFTPGPPIFFKGSKLRQKEGKVIAGISFFRTSMMTD